MPWIDGADHGAPRRPSASFAFPSLLPAFTSVLAATVLWLFVILTLHWYRQPKVDDLPFAGHGRALDLDDGAARVVAEVHVYRWDPEVLYRVGDAWLTAEEFAWMCRGAPRSRRLLLCAGAGTPWSAVGPAVEAAEDSGSFDRIEFATSGGTLSAPERRAQ